MKCNTLIFKCFLQFACTKLDDSQKEVDNFLNLLQKEGFSLRKRRGDSNPGGKYVTPHNIHTVKSLQCLNYSLVHWLSFKGSVGW